MLHNKLSTWACCHLAFLLVTISGVGLVRGSVKQAGSKVQKRQVTADTPVPQEIQAGQAEQELSVFQDSNSIFSGMMDPFPYDPRGRRDPFIPAFDDQPVAQGSYHGPLLRLQRFDLTQLRLVGIIWDVRRPRAMIQDPDGKTHIVGLHAKLGPKNGYIASIREGEIVVVESIEQEGRLHSTTQVVKIAK